MSREPSKNTRVTEARYVGLAGGRPRFHIGGEHAPRWLVKLVESGKVQDGQFIVAGRPLQAGDTLRGRD